MIVAYKNIAGLKGAVVWDPSRPFTLNIATNLSGILSALTITPDMKSMAARLGLPILTDLTTMFRDFSDERQNIANAQSWVYNAYYPQQSREWLANLYFNATSHDGERDFAIQNKIHVFWLPWGANVSPNNC